jgi:hypothetical protein
MNNFKIMYKMHGKPITITSAHISSFKRVVRECELTTVPYQVYENKNNIWLPIRREYVLSELLRE